VSTWDIDPDKVRGVLAGTQVVAMEFEPEMATLNAALQGVCIESSSEIVAKAVVDFVESVQADIAFVFTVTGACLHAAAQATSEYLNGDLEMAAQAQAAAVAAAHPFADRARVPNRHE
jgi:hypothetical protein